MPGPQASFRGATLAYLALVAVSLAAIATYVVRDLDGPFVGAGDINLWGHQGDYVSRHVRLFPFPTIDLVNDDALYPYGGSQVFQPWGFERELVWAALTAVWGEGPWIQWYFLASLAITALGAWALLVGESGPLRAGIAGWAVAFAGYYTVFKFPQHLHASCVHWLTLGILADAVLLRRCWDGRAWSVRLLLARAALLLLCAGLDLGYVAPLAITECALAMFAAGAMLLGRARSRACCRPAALRAGVARHPVQCALLAMVSIGAAWLLVPLAAAVASEVGRFDLHGKFNFVYHSNPLRLLLPVLPGLNPLTHGLRFGDKAEYVFQGSPGLAFVGAALLGVATGWRTLPALLPLVGLFALCVFGHDALMRLPWLEHARIQARWTVAFPAVLAALALLTPRDWFATLARRTLAAALLALFAVEVATAYDGYVKLPTGYFTPGAEFRGFMEEIRRSPGEAVMDWPFCVQSGNLVGTLELCLYGNRNGVVPLLRRFHGKKTVGFYFGRMQPEQLEPFREAGWPRFFAPDSMRHATRQRRDFTEEEWRRFLEFYRAHDFAGIIVYPELLQAETVTRLHAELGAPSAAAFLPCQGTWPDYPPIRAEFIPRRPVDLRAPSE